MINCLRLYIKAADVLSEYVGRAVSLLVPGMVIVLLIEVGMRYFFKSPTLWAYDTAIFMYGYCGVLAGAYTLKHKGHIVVDVVYSLFSPRVKAVMNVLTGLLFFFFCVIFIIYTWKAAAVAIDGGHRANTQWAPLVGHYRLILPIGGGLLVIQGLANWLRDLHFAVTGREIVPAEAEHRPGDQS